MTTLLAGFETWTSTLTAIASLTLQNHALREPVTLRWVEHPTIQGQAYRIGDWRFIELNPQMVLAALAETFFHELAHHIANHCPILTARPADDDSIAPYRARLEQKQDDQLARFLVSVYDQREAEAIALAAELQQEFENQYGPLLAIIGQKC